MEKSVASEIDETKHEDEEEDLKLRKAIRCAKALSLLSSLKSSQIHPQFDSLDHQHEETEKLLRTIDDLKMRLLRERLHNCKIRVCSFFEFVLLVLVMLSLFTLLLMTAFGSE